PRAAQGGSAHYPDHKCATHPQPAGLGDDQEVDVAVGHVVHGQRAGHSDHAHEWQTAEHVAVTHRAAPVVGRCRRSGASRIYCPFASSQRKEAAAARQYRRKSTAAECGPDGASACWDADEIAMPLLGGERKVENVGVSHCPDDGSLELHMPWLSPVVAAPPSICRRGQDAATHWRILRYNA